MADGAKKIVAAASGACRTMSISRRQEHGVVVQGITGSAGSFHAKQCIAYGTQVVAGVTPEPRRREVRSRGTRQEEGRGSRVRHRGRSREADRRRHLVHLRSRARRGRRHPRGGRRGLQPRHLHHRGHPGDGHDPGAARARRARRCGSSARTAPASSRPGACKIGIMPGHIHRPGKHRRRLALRHAHLRGGRAAHGARPRPIDLRRHRRRPRRRHGLRGRARSCSTTIPTPKAS